MPETCDPPADGRLAFSLQQIRELTGLGKETIEAEISEGRLVAVKCRRRTIIRRSDAERWLAELPRRPATKPAPNVGQPGAETRPPEPRATAQALDRRYPGPGGLAPGKPNLAWLKRRRGRGHVPLPPPPVARDE
jgi:excisionase family DNA binding protein